MAFLIGVILREPSGKVIKMGGGREIPLDGAYFYQRGDIYRFYQHKSSPLEANLSNPAPRIKIHAEIGNDSGSVVLQMISSETGELLLLP